MAQIFPFNTKEAWLKLRTQDVTSTESAALFGMSPYTTEFELWHRKKSGEVGEQFDSERMKWGRRFQDPIARGVIEDSPELTAAGPLTDYMRHDSSRMGSSFDWKASIRDQWGLLEVKAVDSLVYAREWTEDEAPAHIEIQLQHQLEVIGYEWGWIVALVGGNRAVILNRKRDRLVGAAIRKKIDAFWTSIEANKPPEPDFTRDAETISRLYGFATPEKMIEANDRVNALANEYARVGREISDMNKIRDGLKAEMLTLVGDAEKVLLENGTISLGTVGPCEIAAHTRKAYRNFKVNLRHKNEQE